MTYYILLLTKDDGEIINGYGVCQTEDQVNAKEIVRGLRLVHPEYDYRISEMVPHD